MTKTTEAGNTASTTLPPLPGFLATNLCAAMQEWCEAKEGEEAGEAFEHVIKRFNHELHSYARAAVLADRQSRAGDAGMVLVPPEIRKISEALHTQDNRITDNPLFAVQQKHQVCGLDDGYEDRWVWVNSDSEEVSDEEEIAWLDAAFDQGDDTPGSRRVGVADRWEFVTGCLTEQGCKDYIRANGHNLHEPRIYAYGSYRNAEFIALRKWLMSLPASPIAAAPAGEVVK